MDKVKEALDIGDKKAEKAKEGQEPVNGQKGNTAAGQPFDAGNDKGIATVPPQHRLAILLLKPEQKPHKQRISRTEVSWEMSLWRRWTRTRNGPRDLLSALQSA